MSKINALMQSCGHIWTNTIYLFEQVCQCSRFWWVLGELDKGKGVDREVSGRKKRKRGIKSVESPQDYHTNPPL